MPLLLKLIRCAERQWLPLQVKSGKEFLKDYYLKHRSLSERDLDELVSKSSMSYEQVRDWFSRTSRRAEEGKELFSEEEAEEEEEGAGEPGDSEGDMEVKEQQEEQEAIQEGGEALSQSQAEEQT